jgi:glycosyltransferase involved in cell wall biosynthesis
LNSKPKVTIAIPVYNSEKNLADCLLSVSNQDYENINILIIYDISQDDSLSIIERGITQIKFPCELVVKDESDRGISKSRNIALKNFSGDYLFFLDSDDCIEYWTIGYLVEQATHHNADIVSASHRVLNVAGLELETVQYSNYSIHDSSSLKAHVYLKGKFYSGYCWNKLYSSTFIKESKVRFFDVNFGEDFLFCDWEIKCAKKIIFSPKITYNYLNHSDSITNSVIYDNMTMESAETVIKLRDLKYKSQKGLYDICCNVDSFYYGFVMIVRDAYKSKNIRDLDKINLLKKAFKTPSIPHRNLLPVIWCKKKRVILILILKFLSFRQKVLLVNIYHQIKNLKLKKLFF